MQCYMLVKLTVVTFKLMPTFTSQINFFFLFGNRVENLCYVIRRFPSRGSAGDDGVNRLQFLKSDRYQLVSPRFTNDHSSFSSDFPVGCMVCERNITLKECR